MKILLVYPNLYGMNMIPPSFGLFTAILKREGHRLALFDTTMYEGLSDQVNSDKLKSDNLNARPFDDTLLRKSVKSGDALQDFKSVVREFAPDLIAVSATEDMYPVGLTLLSALGRDRPKVVMGGVFPTFAPELAYELGNGAIDYILKGEGEETLPELCRRLEQGHDLSTLGGLYMKRGGRIINNSLPRPYDVGLLPLPDYSLFEDSRFYRPMQGKLRRMLPIETVRGCPYTCAYCNSPSQEKIYGDLNYKFFRKQNVELVRNEIKHCIEQYQADSFYFWADTFFSWNEAEFEAFCEMYSEFRLPFWMQTRPETVKAHRYRKLLDIGLLRAAFGIEHGNHEFRKKILSRNVTNERTIENLKIVTDLGVPISVNNILGFPTETRELAFDTIELNRHFKSDGINAYSFTPFHGTPLRTLSEQLGYVTKGALARSITAPTMLSMPQFTKEEIEGVRRCFVLYVKMPKSRWDEIRRAEALTPEGDRIYRALKDECVEKYMHYGDYAKEEDVEKIEFEKDDPHKAVGFRKSDPAQVDFETILRSHGSSGKTEPAAAVIRTHN